MNRWWILFFIPVLTITQTFANNDFEDVFPRPANFVSSEQLKRMSEESLGQVRDKLNGSIKALLPIIRRGENRNINLQLITSVSRFQTQEALEILIRLFREEIAKMYPGKIGARFEVFNAALDAMGAIGTAYPHRYVEELVDLEDELGRLAHMHPMVGTVLQKLGVVRSIMMRRKETIVDLNALLQSIELEKNAPTMTLERAQKVIDERLIGQPEVAQALMDMEWRSQLYGKARTLPDAVYLMGLPGTGKDTAAEVFTDALNGAKGSHLRHMFRLPLLKSKADLWQLLGSATGYIGSEAFPPFLEFLVLHSNGKYKTEEVEQNGRKSLKIVVNPEYKGATLPGYFPPNRGIVFVNEFHNWSKQLKDDFLKQALEKGIFNVNNPNGGLSQIEVPIRFIIASNEGIGLTTSREANGQRHGKAFSYEQQMVKWDAVHENKSALKAEILSSNGSPNQSVTGEGTPGISEELLNRIPERFILLMRPLSPDHLRTIATGYLEGLREKLADSPLLGKVNLTWSDDLPAVIQEYDYVPEENARPVLGRVMSLIEEPLLDALRAKNIEGASAVDLHISVETNSDRSRDLVMTLNGKQTRQLIRTTTKDIARPSITDERIEELAGLEPYLKQNVFGIDDVLERLSERVLSIENEASAGASRRPVNVLMLNGLSSTGKTETAKQLAKYVHKADDELVTFDFSQVQTLHDFKVRILGLKDSLGNPVPSEFMKHYDRANGRLVVAFDELANVRDMDLLKALYDFFREPVVSTFSDGKPRPMGGVTVIITGNPGQELFAAVPRDVPMEVQMLAWEEISRKTNNDPELQRSILEKTYPEPFITRIGRNNIFFLPPHSYKSLRQLAQLKLGQSLKNLASEESRRGWKVAFPSMDEYAKLIDVIIEEGFSLRYQGASIDSFVRDDVEEKIKFLMLKNKVPSGSTVILKFREKTSNEIEDQPGFVFYDVYAEGQSKPLKLKIRRPYVEKPLAKDPVNDLLTAYHEAGHSLVRNALFPGVFKSTMISVIPGVGLIGNSWLYYLGVAKAEQSKEAFTDRNYMVRQIAILMAGETAERLVSKGGNSSAGKSNDIERATRVARDAIIKYGLSKNWGLRAVPTGTSIETYIAGLPESEKRLLDTEIQNMLKEGRLLAQQTIEANFNETFVPLALELAEKGVLEEEALDKFYASKTLVAPWRLSAAKRSLNSARTLARKWRGIGAGKDHVELDSSLPMPKTFADLNAMALKRKLDQYAQVPAPADVLLVPVPMDSQTPSEPPPKRLGVEGPVDLRACANILEAG